MPYPKPLSEKSLDRLYTASGLTGKQIGFLRDFFSACANLYGVIMAEQAWDVYKELSSKTKTVRLRRKDMYAALGIFRREPTSFYVFEADEVFSAEPRSDRYRVVALRDLISSGHGKYMELYQVMNTAGGKPFYTPENLLEYTVVPESRYERELLNLLEGLKSTRSEYEDKWGVCHPCQYTGKYLKDFSYVDAFEDFELHRLRGEIDGFKGNPKKAAEYEAQINSVTAAQYLVDSLKRRSNIGAVSPATSLEYFLDDLNAMGVTLSSEKEFNELARTVNDMHNHQNLWCHRGWSPRALFGQVEMRGKPTVSFGPGLQKAFADGTMDQDEIVQALKEMGLDVLE